MRYSIILPYWNRKSILEKTIHQYRQLYQDIEIVVVDDGEGIEAAVNLPHKTIPLNPCVPINRGVEVSKHDIIVLTNPEVFHDKPILNEMAESLKDEKDYIMAAVREPHKNKWLCHSSVNQRKSGSKGGFHFCTMMTKSFFNEIGGFDEDYREGQGYDDNDFVKRLEQGNANFIMRDDLIAISLKVGRCDWPEGALGRNRKIYERKWSQ